MLITADMQKLQAAATQAGVQIPLSENMDVLRTPVQVGKQCIANRIAIQPMEGCDAERTGEPGELTVRRYDRFAGSGAGLLWFEATAICEQARANPRQVWIRKDNVDAFRALNERIRKNALKTTGVVPMLIMQATHSGRYSKPHGVSAPRIAYNNPLFEGANPLPSDCIVTDDELRQAQADIAQAASLAQEAGFDGVDVKSCHRYLTSELLSAYTREGDFGGSFENRTRFLTESVAFAQQSVRADFLVTSRLNIYDGFAHPYGFGVAPGADLTPDMTEPIRLVKRLYEDLHMPMIDITIGNPYVNPHVNRPADVQNYPLPEDPLMGVARMLDCIKAVQDACPGLVIVGSALSYLRAMSSYLAAGAVEQGYYSIAGFGRMAFAYPGFAHDILSGKGLDERRVCITCGKCSGLMRMGQTTGCVVRDPYYTALFKEASKK